MKLLSYSLKGTPGPNRVGFMLDNNVVDVQESWKILQRSRNENDLADAAENLCPSDPGAFFSAGNRAIEQAKEAYTYVKNNQVGATRFDREEVLLSTPVPEPSKIICIGKNYVEHAAEMQSDIPEYPVLFAKFTNALIGPEEPVEKTPVTQKLDYEVELTAVIGKEASHVNRKDALDYIAGYTIANDISARDLQKRTPEWLQGKTLDRSTPIGPWVVTSDEAEDPGDLSIRSFVNGEVRQSASTRQLIFDIPYLLEFITSIITLKPGDIILTGTPNGVGVAMDPPAFLKDGDVVTLEIENIGRMENRIEELHS